MRVPPHASQRVPYPRPWNPRIRLSPREVAASLSVSRSFGRPEGLSGPDRQPGGLSFAASALMVWNSWSSPPAMLMSVTYLPFTTTVGVLAIR